MNAAKDTDAHVDSRRVVNGEEESASAPRLLNADLPHDDVALQQISPSGARKATEKPIKPTEKTEVEPEKKNVSKKRKRTEQKNVEMEELNLSDDDDEESVPPGKEGSTIINESDVLCGRGGATNTHPGNRHFRDLVDRHRRTYLQSRKNYKPNVSRAIVRAIRKNNGRFLKRGENGFWYEIGDHSAREKAAQALRQRAPEMRKMMFQSKNQDEAKASQQQRQDQHQQQQALLYQQQDQQIQQQLYQQQQMALAAAACIATVPVNPATLMLLNPMMLQRATMASPMFNPLFTMNWGVVTAPLQVPVIAAPPVPLPASITIDAQTSPNTTVASALMGNNNVSASQAAPSPAPFNPVTTPAPANNDFSQMSQEVMAAAALMGNGGGYIQPKPPT